MQHRCRQLLQGDSRRGWYSAAERLPSQIYVDAHRRPSERVNAKQRTVYARNRPHLQEYIATSKHYKGNAIRTTKYSLLTFIPMNLFQQFQRSVFFLSHSVILGCSKNWFNAAVLRTVCTSDQTGFGVHLSVSLLGVSLFSFRAANVYFVFLALLNWVPAVEAFQKEITMIPVLVVLVVIAVKDALEDYRRYLFDKKVNNNKAQVFCR